MSGLALDAGALIAVERRDERMRALLRRAQTDGVNVYLPAGALAQAWRDHPRQHALRVLLGRDQVEVVPLDTRAALAAGALCAATTTRDIVDASVAVCARHADAVVVTSDPADISALDPDLEVLAL